MHCAHWQKWSSRANQSWQNSASADVPQGKRAGRSSTGRGLASDLQGMQAQLADLDAMWSVVNAPKLEPTAGSRVCHKHYFTLHSSHQTAPRLTTIMQDVVLQKRA